MGEESSHNVLHTCVKSSKNYFNPLKKTKVMVPKERNTRLTSDHICLAPHVPTYTQTCTHTSKKS